MSSSPAYQIYPCGDHAITITWGNSITVSANQQVMALYQYLCERKITGVLDLIPAYTSLTIVYDLAAMIKKNPGQSVYAIMESQLQEAARSVEIHTVMVSNKVTIPVCYDLSLAPDLSELAALHQLTIEEVIQLHTSPTYRVYMIGFLPGFAYMGSVAERIRTARKSSPRTKVPAGSVGIAGEQTGIYPLDSPGGWQLIGQTPLPLFDATRTDPCLLQPGDEVKFCSISLTEYHQLKKT
ncbi:MAG TPA: 5-oxoprolinase subunit PxpB [Sediminibacterium sp.]